ncbi:hypothetical protein ACQEVF_57650 [Nonomuraea polychroma]|uniref:hypothetical protein n=1 Tax=Nonomuraea polychroma TaxID=46176 RepID=UPI003D8EE6D0
MQELHHRLYQLHVDADDPQRYLWPDEHDSISILEYASTHHQALHPPSSEHTARQQQAALRLILIRHLRHQLERAELKAIDDARDAGTEWEDIAPLLGVAYPGSAANRRERLRAAVGNPEGERTPAVGRKVHQKQQRAAERARRAEQRAAAAFTRSYSHVKAVATELLDVRRELALNEDAKEYLDSVEDILIAESPTPMRQRSVSSYLRLAAAEIRRHAVGQGAAAARTEAAQQALDAAERV